MRIVRLADIFAHKYKFAAGPKDLEASLRQKISSLWLVPNKTHNVLRACAASGASKANNPNELKAVAGFKFCQELLAMIDYLKNNSTMSLGEMREVVLSILKLITKNKELKFDLNGKPSKDAELSNIQFPHVSELIFQMVPPSTKNAIKQRGELYNKAKTGLANILSIAIGMAEDLQKLEIMVPEEFTYQNVSKIDINEKLPSRFTPQRAPLAENDIIDFIRQYGDDYGISSTEDWATIFMDDPQLKQEITTVINALNRGHSPKDAATVKMQIAEILKNHEERKSSNASFFEDSE